LIGLKGHYIYILDIRLDIDVPKFFTLCLDWIEGALQIYIYILDIRLDIDVPKFKYISIFTDKTFEF